jgi:hypothetical protein
MNRSAFSRLNHAADSDPRLLAVCSVTATAKLCRDAVVEVWQAPSDPPSVLREEEVRG